MGGCYPSRGKASWGSGTGFRLLLLLGEDRPREAIGRGGVDELQHLLVPLLRVHIHREHRPENLLSGTKTNALSGENLLIQALSASAPDQPRG